MKTSAYRTRRVDGTREAYANTLRALHELCFGDSAPQIKPEEGGYWWLTYHEGEPVAFCGMLPSQQWKKTGYLYRVGVLKDHRGKGLQQRLIAVRERYARQLGWTHTVSDTNENIPSANSLIRRGYIMYEPKLAYGLSTAIYWKKTL